MGFYNQFRKFNPKSGDVPGHPFSYLPTIASRVRVLLKTRTVAQIEDAASGIDWAIDEYFRSLKDEEIARLKKELNAPRRWKEMSNDTDFEDAAKFFDWVVDSPENEFSPEVGHWVFNDRMEDELDIQTAGNSSEVDALKNCIDWWDDIGGADFPNGKPEELFAVLSLWLLADAIGWLDHRASESGKRFNSFLEHLLKLPDGMEDELAKAGISMNITGTEINLSLAGECTLKAMDAACYAEHLHEVAKLEAMYKLKLAKNNDDHLKNEAKRRSMVAEKLNIARHRKTSEAKAKAIEEWEKDKSKFISAEKYGLYLADWLEKQGFQYEPRTVIGWIRAHAKQIGVRLR